MASTGDAGSWDWKARFAAGTGAAETELGCWGSADSVSEALVGSGGKAGTTTEVEIAGGKRRSRPPLGDPALEDAGEISGGNNGKHQGEQPLRIRRKVAANRHRVQADDEFQVQDDMDQNVNLLGKQNENLRLQIALKTKELELEESRRLKLELILKTNENDSLLKQNEELKVENEQLKKTAKPPRAGRFCRSCQSYEFHDPRNCPEKPQAARSSEEEVSN